MKPLEWTRRQIPDDEDFWFDAEVPGGRVVAYRDTGGTCRAGFSVGKKLDVDAADLETAKAQAEAEFRAWWREVGRALGELE